MNAERQERVVPKADCAWCGAEYRNIVDLLTHVEESHLLEPAAAAA